jgi:intracellular sulfur oxidation DsrE/DsrF family protein
VVVVRHFLSSIGLAIGRPAHYLFFLNLLYSLALIAVFSFSAHSQDQSPLEPPAFSGNATGYVARILNDSPEEVASALKRAESLYLAGSFPTDANPIAIVLHGPEVEIFFKDKYDEYKNIVDLAARLSAFGVVDVRVCETQSGIMGRERSSIHSFIGTVPFGPTEVNRLLNQQNYVYF